MNQRFRPEPEASAELEDAAVWYEQKRTGLGVEFVQAVDAALDQIARWPRIGERVLNVPSDIPARRWPVNRFPYHAIYLEWEGIIRILAFAHDSREPGFWFSRVKP
jgi:plasmid stabilization system protein ParE